MALTLAGSAAAQTTQERRIVRDIESAKTTLRFFEHHPRVLYSESLWTRGRAWQAVAVARQRIWWGRRRLRQLHEQSLPPHYGAFMCIHSHEGAWDANTGNGYYGGLQADMEFMSAYAPDLLRAKGTADHWTPMEQIWMAERAWRTRGYSPWPQTSRMCGLA